jgi:hypothetical protein
MPAVAAAEAPAAEELCAATAPTFTWARAVSGWKASQAAAERGQNFFTSLG